MDLELQKALSDIKDVAIKKVTELTGERDGKIDDVQKQLDAVESELRKGGYQFKNSQFDIKVVKRKLEPFFNKQTNNQTVEVKSTLFTGSNGTLSDVENLGSIKGTPKTSFRIFDALPIQIMGEGVLRYVQQSGYSNQAGYVAEASAASESTSTLTEVSVVPKKATTYMDFTLEFEKDVGGGLEYVTQNLRDTVLQKFDSYIWNGTTAANGFDGISICATDASASVDASSSSTYEVWASGDVGPNNWDVAFASATYLKENYYNPDVFIVSPVDYFKMVQHKATDGQYVRAFERFMEFGNLRMVVSPTVTAGEYVCLDSRHVAVFIRDMAELQITRSDGNKFISDISTAKLSLRGALACYQTGALIHGTFTDSINALQAN